MVVPAVPLAMAGRNKAGAGGRWGQRGTESSQEPSQPSPLPPRPGGHRRLCPPPLPYAAAEAVQLIASVPGGGGMGAALPPALGSSQKSRAEK